MGAKIWVPLALSLTLGLAAAALAYKVLHASSARHGELTSAEVVVAARDIDPGTALTAEDLTTIKYPAKAVPPEAITQAASLVGRVTVTQILKGAITNEHMLASPGMPAGLQALVQPGMRALSLEINEFSGLGGMLVPGEHVDVIANIRDDKTHETAARTIVQDVTVLAVARSLGAPPQGGSKEGGAIPNTATLLLTPRQAQAIQLASQGSRPWLALRGFHDDEEVNPGTTSLAELRGDPADAAPVTPVAVATTQPAAQQYVPATQPAVAPVQTVMAAPARPIDPPPVRQHVMHMMFGGQDQQTTFIMKDLPSQLTDTPQDDAVPQ